MTASSSRRLCAPAWRAAWCALLLAALAVPVAARAEPLRLGGTGSALATMAELAKAYRKVDPSFQLEVVPNLGSTGGVKALASGAIQLAVISRPLKTEEAAAGLQSVEYGRTPFVLATAKPGIASLTRAQIAALYAGRQTRWNDGQAVRLVLRPASDGDTALLASMSPEIAHGLSQSMARDGMVVGMTDQDAVDAIERLPGGIGTASLALLLSEQRRAHAIAIDGVEPTPAHLASGRYPYAKVLHAVTRADAPAAVVAFIGFIRSDAGRRVLSATGHAVTGDAAPTRAAAAR